MLSSADPAQTDDPGRIWMGRAENRKVGGSIPSLPTASALVSSLLSRLPHLRRP